MNRVLSANRGHQPRIGSPTSALARLSGLNYRFRLVYLLYRLFIGDCEKKYPLRSCARPDQAGSQIHDALMAHAFCFQRGLGWGGAVGEAHYNEHMALNSLLGIPPPLRQGSWCLLPAYYREKPSAHERSSTSSSWGGVLSILDSLLGLNLLPSKSSLAVESIFSPDFLTHLRASCSVPQVAYAGRNVVVHVRRGDISPDSHPDRYSPNHVYENIIHHLRSTLGSNIEITIHSQSCSAEPFSCFEALGVHLKLDAAVHDAWTDMILADILVLSKSSFSYVPALYNPNIVIYQPFWHAPLPSWISLSNPQWRSHLRSLHQTLGQPLAD